MPDQYGEEDFVSITVCIFPWEVCDAEFNGIFKSQIHKNLVRNIFIFGLHLASLTKKFL